MKVFLAVLLVLFFVTGAVAQTPTTQHLATLTWGAPTDATSSGTMIIYRGTGTCASNPTMVSVGTVVATATTYGDLNLAPSTSYCWYVIHSENGLNSVPSNKVGGTTVADPNAPSGLNLVIK